MQTKLKLHSKGALTSKSQEAVAYYQEVWRQEENPGPRNIDSDGDRVNAELVDPNLR